MKKLMALPIVLLSILILVSVVACSSSKETIIYCASGCQASQLGDGVCQSACNNAACYYDNGDCSGSTPTPTHTSSPTHTSTPQATVQTQYSLTLSRSPSNAGTVTCNDNGPYYYGDVVQITASPYSGYEFDYWSGDASGSVNPKSVTITKSTHITAYFTEKDSDNDGVSDIDEDAQGSNPYAQDTDSDGYLDGVDLWPTKDMKVWVGINEFNQLSYCDPFSDWGEPYSDVSIVGYITTRIWNTGSTETNVPDNIRYVTITVWAKDSDPIGSDDPYDISSQAGVQNIDVTFDRLSSSSTVTGDGSDDDNLNDGCQASVTIQMINY
jgi:hypothetical protein